MRGALLPALALLAAGPGCSGATTRNPQQTVGAAGEQPGEQPGATQPDPKAMPPSMGGAPPVYIPNPPASDGGAGGAGGAAAFDCECVTDEIGWWRAGGLVPVYHKSHLSPCNAYSYLESTGQPGGTKLCESTLQGCSETFGIGDVNEALAHPDMQVALAMAPVLYGNDPRALDGQVDHIEVGDKVIEVGNECDQDPRCQIPDGVEAFGQLLGRIELQEMAEDPVCKKR